MPHISPQRRVQIARPEPKAPGQLPQNAGELCWLLTECCRQFVGEHCDGVDALRFEVAAQVTAALEQAKDEFQRTRVHDLEDIKRGVNGDAWEEPPGGLRQRVRMQARDLGAEGLPG